MAINNISTIFFQSLWNLVKMIASWDIVFCFDNCAGYSDLRFIQVIKVEKREPRASVWSQGHIIEAQAIGQGWEMKRPRLRNVPRGSLFTTEITWKNLKSDVDQISEKRSQHNCKERIFFSFVCVFLWLMTKVVL